MPNILIVDDSALERRLIAGLLQQPGEHQVEYAENGAAALRRLEREGVDLVLTDLQMPEMDGLALVREMRARQLPVPVVLMTAFGSEAIAAEALQQGAAGYVPKIHMSDKLLETVKDVLALTHAERSYHRLIEFATSTEFKFALENDESLIPPLVDLAQRMLAGAWLCDLAERLRVGVALEHALVNGLYHGNLELSRAQLEAWRVRPLAEAQPEALRQRKAQKPFSQRLLHVTVFISPDVARFIVRDEGPGFSAPKGQVELKAEAGRGLVLMQTFMDEVTFNAAGNEVTLTRRRDWSRAPMTSTPAAKAEPDPAPRPAGAAAPAAAAPPAPTDAGAPPALRESTENFGVLIDLTRREKVPLLRKKLLVGRGKSCHLVLNYGDVSHHHCQLYVHDGWWFMKDLQSANGVRVNNHRFTDRRLDPGDVVAIAKHEFEIQYDPLKLGAIGPTPPQDPF